MMNKRILSFLLAVMLIVGLMPTSVFATENEGEPAPTPVIEPAEGGEDADGIALLTEEGSEGEEGEGAEPCTVCNEPGCEKTHTQCEACGTWDCEKTHTQCEVCDAWDCTEHKPCDLCGAYDCGGEHEYCTECDKFNCGIDHNAACDKCGVPGCTKAHLWCDTCQKEDCGVSHVWCDTCQKNDCGIDHTVTEPSEETTAPSEGTTVPEEEETKPAGPQVGDKIWIKSGAKVYKNLNNDKSWTLLGNYEVEIEAIETDEAGNPQWYRFKFTTLGIGEALLYSYNYVAAADTTEEQPEETTSADENACDCGEDAPENLAQHADSCPRKSYIKTLFEGKTAEEIYAEWETYDEATQTDILNMLEVYDKSKFEQLNKLTGQKCTCGTENGEHATSCPLFAGLEGTFEIEGVNMRIDVPVGAFPEGTAVSVNSVSEVSSSVKSSMKDVLKNLYDDYDIEILSMKVVDITFTNEGEEVQPSEKILLTFDVPASEISSQIDILAILHIAGSGKAELMAVQNVSDINDISMAIEADSFSHYVVLQSETKYKPTLMRDKLNGNTRYSIVEFPVTLNDFDAEDYNEKYGDGGLWFTTGTAGTGMNLGALPATQGIVGRYLKNGYPVTYGEDRGSIIFSGDPATGKTVHSNVPFEFIYDNQTGYYTYNSGANHAQYNSSTKKVELYADTLAPFNYRHDILSIISDSGLTTKTNSNGNVRIKIDTAGTTAMFSIKDANLESLNSNNYTDLYLRMYSNFSGNIQCRVFYSDESIGYNTGVDYDDYTVALQKGKWADYVFGPFDEGKNVRYVRFYLKSAESGDYIDIDTAGFLQTNNSSEVNFAGLYPFNTTLTTSYAGSEKFSMDTWESLIHSGNNHKLNSSRVMFNTPFTSNSLADDYVYFALATEIDFYIPASGKVNGEEIVFNFNGDDDMWVFVDGELALDIGGAHTDVAGNINFTTGATYVENVRSLTDSTLTGNGSKAGKLSTGQYTAGEYHKLKVFYMERAGTNSNCLIKFNLPVVPTGNVVVEKKVNIENGPSPTEDMIFTFKAEVGGKPFAQKTYTVATKDASGNVTGQTNKTTDANGQFTLKHNEAAYFNGIAENTKVKITEITPQNVGSFAYKSTTVNGASGLSAEKTTTANGISSFSFVNTYEVRLADLKITKKGIDELDHHEEDGKNKEEKQSTVYTVSGTTADGKTVGPIKVAIVGNDSITIKDLPVGSYTVTEDTSWSWRYGVDSISAKNDTNVTVSGASITFDLTYLGEEVTYTNNRNKIYWLSGDSYCENNWGTTEDLKAN